MTPFCVSRWVRVLDTHKHTHTHTLRINGHFSRWTWVSQLPPLILLHLLLDCASFWDRPKLSMSFLTQSHQVFFGCPLCLIPSTSHVIQRLTQSLSSFHSTCPNHLNLLFMIIKLTGSNPKSSLSSRYNHKDWNIIINYNFQTKTFCTAYINI